MTLSDDEIGECFFKFDCSIWGNEFFMRLSPIEKLTYIYFYMKRLSERTKGFYSDAEKRYICFDEIKKNTGIPSSHFFIFLEKLKENNITF